MDDDPTTTHPLPAQAGAAAVEHGRRRLAELIARSPQGLPPQRVVAWACTLASELDALHGTGACHGGIDTRSIVIDEGDAARLAGAAPAGDERGLLLGAAAGAQRRDVRDLAATIYEALSGRRPGPDPAPVAGVSVGVNLALLATLGSDARAQPASAAQLASMLRGGPVPIARRRRATAPALGAAAALGCMLVAGGLWRWLAPGPEPVQPELVQAPLAAGGGSGALADELRAVGSRLRAESARRRWEALAAQDPAGLPADLQEQAAAIRESAAGAADLLAQDRLDEAAAAWEQAAADQEALLAAGVLAAAPRDAPEVETAGPAPAPVEPPALAATPDPGDEASAPEPASSAAGAILVNSLSQTLVFIGPGAFRMGCPPGEDADASCAPLHSVRLSRGFYMGRVEVTRGQFAVFVGAAGFVTSAERQGWALGLDESGRWQRVPGLSWRNPGFTQSDNHPVVCVSHEDAASFCQWVGVREGHRYRLPTEAEWEYACRAGGLTAWPWGAAPTAPEPMCNGADASWAARFAQTDVFEWTDGNVFTSPVATFPANGWGLFDMPGNVQEWCEDAFTPYAAEDAADPLAAAPAGSPDPRVLRGGSFTAPPPGCRAAQRDAAPPGAAFVNTGFRVVMEE